MDLSGSCLLWHGGQLLPLTSLYDCGTSRNGEGYRDVTDSTDQDVLVAKSYFSDLLQCLPAPLLEHDGRPNDPIGVTEKTRRSDRVRKGEKVKKR